MPLYEKKSLREKMIQYCGRTLSTAAVFVGAIFCGSYASLFADEIRAVVPFRYVSYSEADYWSWTAFFFWAVSFAVVVMSIGHAAYNRQIRKQTDEMLDKVGLELNTGVANLTELVTTSPPKNFTHVFATAFAQSSRVLYTLDNIGLSGEIEEQDQVYAIRYLTERILKLAQYWENNAQSKSSETYRANIMIYMPQEEFADEARRAHLLNILKFVDCDVIERTESLATFDGYLLVDPNLSVELDGEDEGSEINSTDGGAVERADVGYLEMFEASPFALGAKLNGSPDDNPSRLIPGAPHALFFGATQWIPDTECLVNEIKDKYSDPYLEPMMDEIKSYYDGETNARSILSIPLFPTDVRKLNNDDFPVDTIAVLNVYRDSCHIISDNKERIHQFSNLVSTLTYSLSVLVSDYVSCIMDKSGEPEGNERPVD